MIRARRDLLMSYFEHHCFPYAACSTGDTALAYANFAASAQSALEECVLALARRAMEVVESDCLVMAGGVALNCSANGALWRHLLAEDLYVQPMANDAGVALGAALLSFDPSILADKRASMSHAYWGPKAEEAEIRAALDGRALTVRQLPRAALYDATARILAGGGLVAWHQGRSEVGPRALGARSLLAHPGKRETLVRVNQAKQREMWRPLAPALVEESFDAYFVGKPNPFMIIAAEVKEHARRLIPAVVHVDGSARPQSVSAKHNPDFHSLLCAFGKIAGVPILVNTSLNVAEEPIACSPADSLRAFEACAADALVIEDFFATRSEAR
jgi:carbamoyltransferase